MNTPTKPRYKLVKVNRRPVDSRGYYEIPLRDRFIADPINKKMYLYKLQGSNAVMILECLS